MQYTLGLGSNIHPRRATLSQARALINAQIGEITAASSLYESEPWGFESSTWFINQNIVVESPLEPLAVLDIALAIETELGRIRLGKGYTSRPIDIDLLLAESLVIESNRLTLPHPHMPSRRFVLLPMVELAPESLHPTIGKSWQELLRDCPDICSVKLTDSL